MQARAAPMPVVRGDRAEAYSLAHDSEVVAGATVGEAGAAIRHEERVRRCPKQPVPFPGIGRQLGGRAVGEWQEAGLAELPRRSVRTPASRSTSAALRESAS